MLQKPALHRIASQRKRCPEVLARSFVSPPAQLEFAKRSKVERIG
jgi:hypothetical protein